MAKPKKNGTYLNVCIETPIYERLEAMCDDAGQSKTVAVERALTMYLGEYEENQRLLRDLNQKKAQKQDVFLRQLCQRYSEVARKNL